MKFKELLDGLELDSQLTDGQTGIKLIWKQKDAGFDVFQFSNSQNKPEKIGNDADYLKLFMNLGERVFRFQKEFATRFIFAVNLGGELLFAREYTQEEQNTYKYSYVALSKAGKELSEAIRPERFAFFCETGLVDTSTESFEKEAPKVARILSGESLEVWKEISEKKINFIKTDMYLYMLQKLHSWGFQTVTPDGGIDPKQYLVREKRPQPRGTLRKKRTRKG